MSDLEKLTEDVKQIYQEYEKTGTRPWTYETAAIDLSYQVGSLSKLLLQLRGDRYTTEDKSELTSKVSDELADILAEVLFIASELDIDLNEAWNKMLESDNQKISKNSK